MSVRAKGYVSHQPSTPEKPKGKFFLFFFSVSGNCVQAKICNGTTVGMFSNFNLLLGHCTLLPFSSILMSLCTPGVIDI